MAWRERRRPREQPRSRPNQYYYEWPTLPDTFRDTIGSSEPYLISFAAPRAKRKSCAACEMARWTPRNLTVFMALLLLWPNVSAVLKSRVKQLTRAFQQN